jgi:hypothetical protein
VSCAPSRLLDAVNKQPKLADESRALIGTLHCMGSGQQDGIDTRALSSVD